MCSIQWTESVVTGTADAFDFNAAANDANAQVIGDFSAKIRYT